MRQPYVTRERLMDFIRLLDATFARPGRLYLIGETTQTFEGWREWTTHIEFTSRVAARDRELFAGVVEDLREQFGVAVFDEFPGDAIPLPARFEARARPAKAPFPHDALETGGVTRHLALYHFDPCSVALRFIARGDEPDYHMVLMFLERGWLTLEEMDARLAELLPRFTARTIQQDPAEFRRKYDGLVQMWRAVPPRTTHRPTIV